MLLVSCQLVVVKKHLHEISVDICTFALQNNIKIIPQWIPREQNQLADHFSRVNDTDNWGIDFKTFFFLNKRYGPYTVDRFADDKNTKLSVFNSKFYCPGTAAVNAFTENWHNENNWICPPVKLIGSIFRHMSVCKCKGVNYIVEIRVFLAVNLSGWHSHG